MTQNKPLCDSEQNRTCLILRHFGWQGGTWTQVHEKLLSLKIKGYIDQIIINNNSFTGDLKEVKNLTIVGFDTIKERVQFDFEINGVTFFNNEDVMVTRYLVTHNDTSKTYPIWPEETKNGVIQVTDLWTTKKTDLDATVERE